MVLGKLLGTELYLLKESSPGQISTVLVTGNIDVRVLCSI